MDKENGARPKGRATVRDLGDRRERGSSVSGAPATYETKFRRMLLVVAGMVFEPNVPIPPSLQSQARATFLALVNAEFGDELNAPTPEDDDEWHEDTDVGF